MVNQENKFLEEFYKKKNSINKDFLFHIISFLDIHVKDEVTVFVVKELRHTSFIQNVKIIELPDMKGLTNRNLEIYRKWAIKYALNNYRDLLIKVLDTGMMVEINKKGILKTFSRKVTKVKINSVLILDKLLENSVYVYSTKSDTDVNQILYHHFFAVIRMNHKNAIIRIVVKEFSKNINESKKFYYHQLEIFK